MDSLDRESLLTEIVAGLEKENGLTGQFVTVHDAHLSPLNQPVFLQGSEVMRNQLLALFQALCEFGLGWELPHVTVLVQEVQDFALKTVGVG